ncbi:hypothetical protein [Amorphus coralli]|uniref:hypothetical protein n=1 Tax=Amorphus coralli TaxID=340680 RepID=UPI0003731C28|nr:hypothetical protein [Amorphus coralli]
MFAKKTIILVATTLAIAGGALGANAAPLNGASFATNIESRTVEVKKRHGHGGRHHAHRGPGRHGHHGHRGPHRRPGLHAWGPGYVGYYPPRRCRIERVKVYDPYIGRRVWVRERVCFRR